MPNTLPGRSQYKFRRKRGKAGWSRIALRSGAWRSARDPLRSVRRSARGATRDTEADTEAERRISRSMPAKTPPLWQSDRGTAGSIVPPPGGREDHPQDWFSRRETTIEDPRSKVAQSALGVCGSERGFSTRRDRARGGPAQGLAGAIGDAPCRGVAP